MTWRLFAWLRPRADPAEAPGPGEATPHAAGFDEPETQGRRSFALVGPPANPGFGEAPAQGLDGLPPELGSRARGARMRPDETDLLARILSFVLPGDGRTEASSALRRFGSLAGVLAAPESELRTVPGLGTHSVAAIKLVQEAALRLARANLVEHPVLDSRERLYGYLSAVLAHERVEQFRILFLDGGGMLRADEVQGRGTVNHTPVYPREVVRRALELKATAVVLVHNHPSGDPTPSRDDVEMTSAVQDAARALGISVLDHVIVGAGKWVSLTEQGLM